MKFLATAITLALAAAPAALAFIPHAIAPTRPFLALYSSTTSAAQITMPALSSTMKEGKVVSWLVSEGDEISAGDAIMVVESDKADMDVEAFEDGVVAKILVEEGEMAPVGQAVALIAEDAEQVSAVIAEYQGAAASAPAAVNGEAPVTEEGTEMHFVVQISLSSHTYTLV